MLSELHNFKFSVCTKQYYKKSVLCLLVAPPFFLAVTNRTNLTKQGRLAEAFISLPN